MGRGGKSEPDLSNKNNDFPGKPPVKYGRSLEYKQLLINYLYP
jgi:hypothetical protein